MRILNSSQKTVIAQNASLADTPLSRLQGLLGRKDFPTGEALVITQCRSIHMMFMHFAIDVIFADKEKRVVGVVKDIRPFSLSPYFWRAFYAIELPVGTIALSKTCVGDELGFETRS